MSVKNIVTQKDAKARDDAVAALLAKKSLADLQELITAATDDANQQIGNAKAILKQIVETAGESNDGDFAIGLCNAVIDSIAKRFSTYGEESLRAREVLADIYEGGDMPTKAIGVLTAIPTDSTLSLRSSKDDYKASLWVRIASLFIDTDNETQAEVFIQRAWPLMKHVKDSDAKLSFETVFAQVADANRKFLDAGNRYYQLSHRLEDGLPALRKAIVCCVLTEAGPQRARLLALMMKDERALALGDLHGILNKLFMERILREKDIAVIKPFLKEHHQAMRADGRTFFQNAVIQHNLLSASKLYYNIRFQELGNLLGVEPRVAEKIAAQMIAEDRLKATIDQVEELISFLSDPSAPILTWDAQIAAVCHSITQVSDEVARTHATLGMMLMDK